jgi:ribonuclease HI
MNNSPLNTSEKIIIYTDGACSGNPGKGGYGAVLMSRDNYKEIFGFSPETTNNKMEITAVIEALKTLKRSCNVIIYTDSKYVMDGITKWISSWKRNGWKTADRKPVKNVELWQELDLQCSKHSIQWQWVKGHSGDKYNEIVDKLARSAIENNLKQ